MTTNADTKERADAPTTPRRYDHLIAGRRVESDEAISRRAPGTGAVVAEVAPGGPAEVDSAVRAARAAFDVAEWPRLTGIERAAVLNRVADLMEARSDELARLDAEEGGKPLRLAEGDIAGAVSLTRYAAGLGVQMHGSTYTNHGPDFTGLVLREPVGVVGLITPWNFPALILCQKLPFALAAGCTVVVKPSELTTGSTIAIAELYAEAGLPAGALNVVTGDGRAGAALAEHAGVDLLSFTGSTATGRRVIAASQSNVKRLSLELGGKAASLVFADANLEDAAEGATFGVFFNNGECCVSHARLLVQDAIADEFLAELARRAQGLQVGQPLQRTTDVGPMIHEGHLAKVLNHVHAGLTEGATVLTGGERAVGPGLEAGQFVEPTIIDAVTPTMRAFREEIFGPVLTVTRFHDAAEAVALANDVDYGLANTIWSKDLDTVLPVARALRSGTVWVNTTIDAPPTMPFGGYKASGFGREMGQAGFDEFTEVKSVNIRTGRRAGSFAIGSATSEPAEAVTTTRGDHRADV
jgi:acyl-CoA reductase-like NAD-dependent aldehyde dehydrogenase